MVVVSVGNDAGAAAGVSVVVDGVVVLGVEMLGVVVLDSSSPGEVVVGLEVVGSAVGAGTSEDSVGAGAVDSGAMACGALRAETPEVELVGAGVLDTHEVSSAVVKLIVHVPADGETKSPRNALSVKVRFPTMSNVAAG